MKKLKEISNQIINMMNEQKQLTILKRIAICAGVRILMEFLSERNFNKKLTSKMKEGFLTDLYLQEISFNLHNKVADERKSVLFYKIVYLMGILDEDDYFGFSKVNTFKDEIKWLKNSEYKEYNGFICSKSNLDLIHGKYLYEISYEEKEFSQKRKRFFSSEISLSVGQKYKLKYTTWSMKSSPRVKMKIIVDAEIKEIKFMKETPIVQLINEFQLKTNKSVLDYIYENKIYTNEGELINKMRKSFNSMQPNDRAKNLIFLKYNSNEVFRKNFIKYPSPLCYEFWTKNPRGKKISFRDKENIVKYIYSENEKEPFIKNEEFFISSTDYLSDYYENWKEDFPDNDNFNFGYNQKQIVEYTLNQKKYLTIYEWKNMMDDLESLKALLKFYDAEQYEEPTGISKDKKKIFKKILSRNISVVTGMAGTGKTLLISKLIKHFKNKAINYIYLAPTHKAKNVMEEFHDENINTDTVQNFTKEKSDYTIASNTNIIIDEISMMDDHCWNYIIKYIHKLDSMGLEFKLVLIGDENQIPPINSFGFSRYIFEWRHTFKLKRVFRQENSGVLCEYIKSVLKEKEIMPNAEFVKTFANFNELMQLMSEFKDYQFLTPINKGLFGKRNISKILSENESDFQEGDEVYISETSTEYSIKKIIFANRKLKIKRIHHHAQTKMRIFEFYPCIKTFQAISGKVEGWYTRVSQNPEKLSLFCEVSSYEDIPFENSEAITIHSAQGSTFDKVALIIPPFTDLDWRMLYTAISRAKTDLKILIMNSI